MIRKQRTWDVVVIGGGIAGLAAADFLSKKGVQTLLLESKSRMGGRIYTHRHPFLEIPIELGAEFIHGAPAHLLNHLESQGLSFYDVDDTHFYAADHQRDQVKFWDRIDSIQKKLSVSRKKDQSILSFVKNIHSLDSISRSLFLEFIEGFHAADPRLLSEKAMALAQKEGESDIDDIKIFRITRGYQTLVESFIHSISKSMQIRTDCVVRAIHWRKGDVQIRCESSDGHKFSFRCARVVITVPIGVLTSGLMIDPLPPKWNHLLSGFATGHVQRLIFVFKSRFWEDRLQKPVSFLHAGSGTYFPVWWSQSPVRAPILIAWQGGPRALELSTLRMNEKVEIALSTLGKMLKIYKSELMKQLDECYSHNWTNDPHSLGAYSYLTVNGVNSWKKFQRPIENTLFFAGEAFASHADRATVHGAMASGIRVAKQILVSP